MERAVVTFHTAEPVALEDGEELVVQREGSELVARRVAELDSDEPIHSFRELEAAALAAARRTSRG